MSDNIKILVAEDEKTLRDIITVYLTKNGFDVDAVCSNIVHDKKNTDTGLKFILLKKIGKAVIVNDVSEDEIREATKSLIVEWD